MGWNELSDPDMRTANFEFSCDVYREGVYMADQLSAIRMRCWSGNAVHKAELRSQILLYQTLYIRWNENDIQHFLKTVGFHQKYSEIKTQYCVSILKGAELNQAFAPPVNHSNFSRRYNL